MGSLLTRLEHADVRLTAQRRIIAECLDGEDRHVSADQLLVDSQARLPEIGRATVYKALAAFLEVGAIRQVQVGDGPALFDPNAHVEHHHQSCDRCGGIWDTPLTTEIEPESGFLVRHVDVTIHGVCASCQQT